MAKEYHLMSPEELKEAWMLRFNKDVPDTVHKLLAFFKRDKREEPGAAVQRPGGLERDSGVQ